MTNLTALFLSNTQLSGSIPAELGNLTNLTELFLSYNQLSGSIPAELGDLTNLEQLSLNSNQLSGSIPAELVNLTNLGSLNLGENQLSGSISAELGKLSDLGRLELAENQLSGSIPAELGDLTNLTSLILDSNQLSGSIPAELGNISSLHDLYLNNNQLSGSIPVSFASSHIRKFTYFNTTICVPNNDIIHDWLDRIYNHGAGLECDQATGLISGKVTGQSNDPHPNISVTLYQDFSSGGFDFDYALIDNVETDAYGYYQFDGLGNGEYILRFRDPSGTYSTEYYNNQFTIDDAESVTVTLGNTINVDAVLDDLTTTPPVAEVTAGSGSITPNPADGSSIVNMPRGNATDINVSMAATCDDNSTPSAVFLRIKNANQEYGSYANLSMIQDSGNDYVVTVPIGIITFSNNTFTVRVVCAEGDERTLVATVRLYDPMGIIRDEFTGEPIEGAKVFLFRVPDWYPKTGSDDDRANTCQSNRSKSADASWNQSAPTELGVWVDPVVKAISPETAVQLTDNEGYYGWDVSIGCWYVIVEAVGYKPMVSPVVGVHPAVTDLHLQLEPYVYNNHIFLPTINR